VASLKWWNTLSKQNQVLIQTAMADAAGFQRKDNREKDEARLVLLAQKGMEIETRPDIDAFRAKVAALKDMELYQAPKVHDLLTRMIQATK
jgi:TRAP-type C4-dicarboxylate transport system substrate-binding protein